MKEWSKESTKERKKEGHMLDYIMFRMLIKEIERNGVAWGGRTSHKI